MSRAPKRSDKNIAESAAQYSTKADFARGDASGYVLAKRRKILNEICGHMKSGRVKWTKERCIKEAQKFSSRWELGKANKTCYNRIHTMGWEVEAFAHMRKPQTTAFTKEYCLTEVKKYSTRSELLKAAQGIYWSIRKNGWSNEAFKHFIPLRTYYSASLVKEIAVKYKTRKEFQQGHQAAYNYARKHSLLDKICAHMETPGNVYLRYVYEIRNDERREIYIGISCDPRRRFRDHRKTGIKGVQEIIKAGAILSIVSKLLPAEVAGRIEQKLISKYQKDGWVVLNEKEGGGLGAPYRRIKLENIQKASKLCCNRKEFREKYASLAQAADRWGISAELFKNHPNKGYASKKTMNAAASMRKQAKNGRRKLSKDFCIKIAQDFFSPTELHKHDQSVYRKILNMKWQTEAYAISYSKSFDRLIDHAYEVLLD